MVDNFLRCPDSLYEYINICNILVRGFLLIFHLLNTTSSLLSLTFSSPPKHKFQQQLTANPTLSPTFSILSLAPKVDGAPMCSTTLLAHVFPNLTLLSSLYPGFSLPVTVKLNISVLLISHLITLITQTSCPILHHKWNTFCPTFLSLIFPYLEISRFTTFLAFFQFHRFSW